MKKTVLTVLIMLFLSTCEKQRFDDRNPRWVEELIEDMETNPYYSYSVLSRYAWDNHFYYEIFNPISSCAYCDVFDYKGNRINWEEYDLEDYLQNRTDMVIIWRGVADFTP